MHYLYLPYLTGADTIQLALERMKQTNSRAIVVESNYVDAHWVLYTNRQVLEAWRNKATRCQDLQQYLGEGIASLTWVTTDALETDALENTLNVQQILEHQLDQSQSALGMLFPPSIEGANSIAPQRTTLVITRHEGKSDELRSRPKACICTGTNQHQADSPPKVEGAPCEYGDGGTYACY